MPDRTSHATLRPLSTFPTAARRRIRFVLTDIDDTLTFAGRLAADTYAALERLERAGIAVVPVTAAPAGWCDLIARFWPVRAVIGENGGFYFRRDADTRGIFRAFWLSEQARVRSMARLAEIADTILAAFPSARTAADQPFRQTSRAIEPGTPETADRIAAAWRAAGARSTVNSLWALGWFGEFDKLAMALRLGREILGVDLASERDAVVYVGDSLNDEPMFRFFPHAVGVATVRAYLARLDALPAYVTDGPGGAGFVEIADALLAAR
jgi:HAD superfamily hydrolase (TIGR01484 family)